MSNQQIAAAVRACDSFEFDWEAFFPGIPDLFGRGQAPEEALTKLYALWRDYKIEKFLSMRAVFDDGPWKEWLASILKDLIEKGEDFDSKRPYGESGWESVLADNLEEAGNVKISELVEYIFRDKCRTCGEKYIDQIKEPNVFPRGCKNE